MKELWIAEMPWFCMLSSPLYHSYTGCYQCKIGEHSFDECYLFSMKLDFEKAKEYRKSYGAYLRKCQWNDIDVEVWMMSDCSTMTRSSSILSLPLYR